MDRFHLVEDVVAWSPQLGVRAAYPQQAVRDKLIEHKQYIREHGDDMPEIRDWKWGRRGDAGNVRAADTAADNA
jgi:xylulose-5-phosphate/fructose-6-phosphate phosphoketolase